MSSMLLFFDGSTNAPLSGQLLSRLRRTGRGALDDGNLPSNRPVGMGAVDVVGTRFPIDWEDVPDWFEFERDVRTVEPEAVGRSSNRWKTTTTTTNATPPPRFSRFGELRRTHGSDGDAWIDVHDRQEGGRNV